MTLPGQSYDHNLDPKRGWVNNVELVAQVSSNVLYTMVAGQCAHQNSVGDLEPGCIAKQMGLFLFQGAGEKDVQQESSQGNWSGWSPTGNILCLAANGGYLLETTEFNTALTYVANDTLKSPTGNAAVDYPTNFSGMLTNASVVFGTNAYVGLAVVDKAMKASTPNYENNNKKQVIQFLTVYSPTAAA